MAFITRLFIVCLCLVQLECEVYKDRPKIKTNDGDLILEPAYGKNLYIKPNGPQSKVYVGDVNLLSINMTSRPDPYQFNDKLQQNVKVPQELLQRIDQLETATSSLTNNFLFNVTFLARRINNLNNRIRTLQNQINNRGTDDCQTHSCENGGTCLSLVNGYHCLCPSAWKGRSCDEDVNECRIHAGTDLGCQNGATCINRPGSYECICKPGWYGLDCTRKLKDCSGGDFEMCGHGTCIPVTTGDGIKCICNQGWSTNGTHVACLTDVNECESGQGARCSVNPRVECINLPGSFKCGRCPPGYEGDGFSCYDIDECLTLPNGGCSTSPMVSCHNTIGSRICGSCPSGYQGDGVTCTWRGSCSINHGGCHPSAQCVERPALGNQVATCICPYGMAGDGIGIHGCYISVPDNKTQTCENNPCGSHGRCHILRQGFTCICYQGYSGMYCEKHNDYCSHNPCLNGGTCILEEKSSKGFRCECTSLYSGNVCELRSQPCGGVLDAEEGSITYPISNSTSSYLNNALCAWIIHTAPDKVINVTFSKFNLEYHSQCHYDFVQIHDGRSSASQLIGRFCGNKFPNGGNIISSHNNLYFWFRSDPTVAKSGFALHWTSIPPKCGGELDATTHGHISSPGSPGSYPPNRDCYWHLKTTLGKRIQLHFYQLDIEIHVNCSNDYIAIYDGAQILDPLISKYCNSTQPPPLESAGSEMLIHFHSDESGSGKGFQISFAPIEGVPGCGGSFTSDKGEIVSPSYDGSYLNNLLCEYKIKSRPDTKIRIKFISFNIERSIRCRYDYLKVYDGASSNSRLIGTFCGKTSPSLFVSTSNSLYIIFKSDHTTALGGFKLQYESICHKTISGDSGIIKSPGYPLAYPKQTVCEYVISTTPGKAIQLTFQDFDIEDNRYYNCQYDHVEVRDGPNSNSTLMGRFCGGNEITPPIQISSYNYMYIKFNSDTSITGSGFYANYTTIAIECGGIFKETTGIINHPVNGDLQYKKSQACTWMIIAPEGMHIQLTWKRFDLEELTHCDSDYVELIELTDASNENYTLGKYCGNSLPPAITVSSNIIMLKFKSDSTIQFTGFSLSYTFLDEKTHCGGVYVKTHGFIYTPGWPVSYEHNRDCTWTISVPVGQQVSLNISDFDLERPIRDKCDLGDHLTIRDGSSQSSPLIGKFCGSFKTKIIVSTAHHVYLHFHSDFYLSGKGFKIEWDGTLRGCGGTLTSDSGSISSPNYPQIYNEDAECFYKIITSRGSRIRISFTNLDLERSSICEDDYVEIFDGQHSNSHSLGKYCELSTKTENIYTSSSYAFIKFRSDFYLSGTGFLLNYQTVCNNNISGSYGVIESPGFPDKYPLNTNCLWTITVPKGNVINISFTDFNLFVPYRPYGAYRFRYMQFYNSNGRCEFDYVQLKETTSVGNVSEKLCGSTLPRAITSKTNSFQIKFVSSYFYPQKGFRLEWFKNGCGNHIQRPSGSLTFDEIKQTGNEIECDWLLETPTGTSITIIISDFYLAESKNCSLDAIEIYNGQSTAYPLLTRVCHRDGNIKVKATSNLMLVRLVKRSSQRDIYMLSHFDSGQRGCGGVIESQSGIIHSKNYPNNYENSMDCIWYISVPNNHKIEINFVDLDLFSDEYDDDDQCYDSLKIYDGSRILNSNYSYLICPKTNISSIVSQHSSLTIQFSTNNYGTAKGFLANFTMVCGAIIEAQYDGIISNNNYINSKTRNCTWTILASNLNKKVKLTIQHLNLHRNSDIVTNRHCPSSFLKVYDGDDEESPLIDEFCGNKVPPTIVSHGNALTITLGTYTNSIEGDFSAHYTSLSTSCGGELTSEEGSIGSPNYPLSYPANTDCEWTLKTSPGNRVYITFEKFDLDDSEGCNEDYLEVRENDGGGNLLALYCGDDIPINTTSASKLYVKFHSNNVINGLGFLLHYGFLHGNDIIGLHRGEIASPLYPYVYRNEGVYTWRITAAGMKNIVININVLEIPKYSEVCNNKLIIYDGYDEDAPILEELCGILRNNAKTIKTSSSIVFIQLILDETNTGAQFYLKWSEIDRIIDESYPSSKKNCGSNTTRLVNGDHNIVITSPNYPNAYDPDLNCEWIFKSEPGRHLKLQFRDLMLEETANCFADYVSIYTSNSPSKWTALKENMCLSLNASEKIEGSTYMKIAFKTDQSLNNRGFTAIVASVCGSLLDDESGVIQYSYYAGPLHFQTTCDWIIKVRPGRTIKLRFDYFNITNDDICNTYVMLRNGGSNESPLLGDGKYCGYAHENRSELISSSHYVFVRYVAKQRYPYVYQNFKLRYEEKNIECGFTSILDSEHKSEVITSPKYPRIPTAYTECVWIFTGPPGEILRIEFIERFDLDPTEDCSAESVEVRDGLSRMSPVKGIFCKERPSTIKTTSNTLFIKYSTQLSVPRNGFKANISIDVCGATIISKSGEIESPNYPHMMVLPIGTICEWHIISTPGHTIKIAFKDIDLPESEKQCESKITIEDSIPADGKTSIGNLKEICDNDFVDLTVPIETNTNKVVVKLHFGKPAIYTHISDNRGFLLSFNSSRPICGETITTSEGYITTPGYPRSTPLRYCMWKIVIPNEKRRVRLEIEDTNPNIRFGAYNDVTLNSIIEETIDITNSSNMSKVFESTGNKLAFFIWIRPLSNTMNRFKAKFSSNSPALCGGNLEGIQGQLGSPNISRSYICEWKYIGDTIINNTVEYRSMYVTLEVTASNRNICRYTDSSISIQSQIDTTVFTRKVCGKNTHVSYRIPSSSNLKIKATQQSLPLFFKLKWKLQPCGGIINVNFNDPINILNIPDRYDEPIDCGWILVSENGIQIELKLEGTFNLECSNEYVIIKQGGSQTSLTMAEYCKDKVPDHPLVTSFMYTYIQYHSSSQTRTNIKLLSKTLSVQCGGFLTKFQRIFTSPNYPHNYQDNQECTWEIQTDLGYRVSLQFIDRFVIEDKVNCTKDVVIIYDWRDNTYNEIARVCGRNRPLSFNSTYNQMKVVFRSDANITLDGFKAQWTPICGGNFVATEKEQILYSPGYNTFGYYPSLNCHYTISASSKKIIVTFLTFEMEGSIPDCKYDNLTITAENNYNYIHEIYCGNVIPRPVIVYDNVKLNFKTDKYGQRTGFKISYAIYTCGAEVKVPTDITLDNVSDNINCTWSIEAPSNKFIVLKFDYINLESSYDCYSDYLAIFEGPNINSDKRLALFCGRINSTYIKSTGNKMILQLVTDNNFNSKGFSVKVVFSYTESVGCGGKIDLTSARSHVFKSPLLGNALVYESYLDCYWNIKAPTDHIIKIEFTSFHIAPCLNVNQTSLGFSKCDCDYVMLKDGLNPDSLMIGKYCGHSFPPQLSSSGNLMSIVFSTDGDITSSGFEATLSTMPSTCGQSVYAVSKTPQHIMSPGYKTGSIPRGLHCSYYLDSSLEPYSMIYVSVRYLDLQPGTRDQCDQDRLVIHSNSKPQNSTTGKDFILNEDENNLIQYAHIYSSSLIYPKTYTLCGQKHSVDFYLTGSTNINLLTSPEATSAYKGVDIEISYVGSCSRNYSEPQGRIQNSYETLTNSSIQDCYTLITAPENFTISAYFISVTPNYWQDRVYLEIFDGNVTGAPLILKIVRDYTETNPVFSSGRYLLFHNHYTNGELINYDINYITTDKGKGCGGKLYNELGRITSPLYPENYRRKSTCEWELETPTGTYLLLHFTVFDLGNLCDQNYVSLINRNGDTISTYCLEMPADYVSPDNYVKIAFTTTMNNGGTGWVADFVGTL